MNTATSPADALRQMLAILEEERHALAALDIDALSLATLGKHKLCVALEHTEFELLDAESRGLAMAAKAANEINRKIRNLVAANIAARLDALTGSAGLYQTGSNAPRKTTTHA